MGASYTWKSIWVAKKALMDGLRWKIEGGIRFRFVRMRGFLILLIAKLSISLVIIV